MTRKPIDYSKTTIYKIVSRNPELSGWKHIDFTTDFIKRKNYIKTSCANGKDAHLFNFINANGGFAAFDMLMLAEFPTTNKELVKTHIFGMMNPTH
jgi:hypothetical protein